MLGATSHIMMEVCGGTSHVMTKVYDSTNRIITEVGGGASCMMKVCRATESILINHMLIQLSLW